MVRVKCLVFNKKVTRHTEIAKCGPFKRKGKKKSLPEKDLMADLLDRLQRNCLDPQLMKDMEKINKQYMNKMEPSTKRKQKGTVKKFWSREVQ